MAGVETPYAEGKTIPQMELMAHLRDEADDDDVSDDEFTMVTAAQRESARRPMTAAAVNKYRFIRRLGGTAYLAKENNIRQDWRVIRKLRMGGLPMATVEGVMEQLRARQESLKQPSFIQMLDLFQVDKVIYVVTEYCEGGTLGALVSRAKRFGEQLNEIEVLDWLVQMLKAAEHMRQRNMVHGLIATGNVLLKANKAKLGETKQGKEFLKMPDVFKLVHDKNEKDCICAHEPGSGRVTAAEMTYYSPEVLQGSDYTHLADVWSIGCVLYEMCSQKRIFMAETLEKIADNITNGPLPEFPTYFSLDLANLWRSIIVKDVNQRPSAQEILDTAFIKAHIEDMEECDKLWSQDKLETVPEDR